MGNKTCRPKAHESGKDGEGLKAFLTRKFGKFSENRKIDELVKMALMEDCERLKQYSAELTKGQLDTFYQERDKVVDEFADDVIEVELVGLGTNAGTVNQDKNARDDDNNSQKSQVEAINQKQKNALQKVKVDVNLEIQQNQTSTQHAIAIAPAQVDACVTDPTNHVTEVAAYEQKPGDGHTVNRTKKGIFSIFNRQKGPRMVHVQPCDVPDGHCFQLPRQGSPKNIQAVSDVCNIADPAIVKSPKHNEAATPVVKGNANGRKSPLLQRIQPGCLTRANLPSNVQKRRHATITKVNFNLKAFS